MTRLLLVALTAALVFASPAAAGPTRSCESFATDFGDVTAKGLTCTAAAKVTTAHRGAKSCARMNADGTTSTRRCTVRGYVCATKKVKGGTRVNCSNRARTKSVRFTIYG